MSWIRDISVLLLLQWNLLARENSWKELRTLQTSKKIFLVVFYFLFLFAHWWYVLCEVFCVINKISRVIFLLSNKGTNMQKCSRLVCNSSLQRKLLWLMTREQLGLDERAIIEDMISHSQSKHKHRHKPKHKHRQTDRQTDRQAWTSKQTIQNRLINKQS